MIKYEASQQLFPAFRGRVFRTAAAFRCHTEDQVTKLRETAKALEVLVLLENNICWVCWLGLVFLCSFSGWTDFLDLQDFYDSKWSVSFFFFFGREYGDHNGENLNTECQGPLRWMFWLPLLPWSWPGSSAFGSARFFGNSWQIPMWNIVKSCRYYGNYSTI